MNPELKKSIEDLIEMATTLCDAELDTPCGCDGCPYGSEMTGDGECKLYEVIANIRKGIAG